MMPPLAMARRTSSRRLLKNHYETFGAPSPMVFLDKEFFTKEVPIYPLLDDLLSRGKYKNLLISVTDDPQEVIDTLMNFPGA